MTDKAITDLSSAASAASADLFYIRKDGETEDKSITGTLLASWMASTILTTANQLSVFSSGTVYALTATAALLNFGTTDPSLTITSPGTYKIQGTVVLGYNAATFSAVRTATLKFRRTNNTAADLTNGSIAVKTSVVTTETSTMMVVTWACHYSTSNTDDNIQIFGSLDVVPSAGSLDASYASITMERLPQ